MLYIVKLHPPLFLSYNLSISYGGEKLLEEKLTISTLSEELVKLMDRISNDCRSLLVELDGSLKDIEVGTLIKIPLDVGYVKFYKSQNYSEISVWNRDHMTDMTIT